MNKSETAISPAEGPTLLPTPRVRTLRNGDISPGVKTAFTVFFAYVCVLATCIPFLAFYTTGFLAFLLAVPIAPAMFGFFAWTVWSEP